MSEPLENFFKAFSENDGDKAVLEMPFVSQTVANLEKFGVDLGESAENYIKNIGKRKVNIANPQSTLPPNLQELSYIEPKNPTTLYNVSNNTKKEPFLQKVFGRMSYGIRNWNVEASSMVGKKTKITAIMGEEFGLSFNKQEKGHETDYSLVNNVRNGKTSFNYYNETPADIKQFSLFKQNDNVGATVSYYSKDIKISTGASIDRNSLSVQTDWRPQKNIGVGIYANKDFHNSFNNVVGITGKITM